MDRRKRVLGGAVSVAAVLALMGAVAWACTPLASIRATPAQGAPGTDVALTGSSFDPKAGTVRIYWGGASGRLLTTAPINASGAFSANIVVPSDAYGGSQIIAAVPANGSASPTNLMFRVDNAPPAPAAPAVTQGQEEPGTITEPVTAEAPAAAPVQSTPGTQTVAPAAPRVRPAPRTAPAARPAAATPAAPAASAPAPVATPAPAVATPAPESAPVTEPARRSVMVSMASGSEGSPVLAIALVGVGLALALGASALVLAGRRVSKAPAPTRR